eukprot:g76724.t1
MGNVANCACLVENSPASFEGIWCMWEVVHPDSIEVQWFLRKKGLSEDPSAQQPPEIETKSMISLEPGHLRRSKHLLSYVQIATSQNMVFSTALPPDNWLLKETYRRREWVLALLKHSSAR